MTEPNLRPWIEAAGLLHFCQVPAMLYFRRHVLQLEPELEKLARISRRVFQVLGVAIVMTVIGTGALVLVASEDLTHRTRLSIGLLSFLGLFWGMRALCQGWYASVWPSDKVDGRVAHYVLLLIFSTQTALYGYSAASLLW